MKTTATLALMATAAMSFAQMKFDDITSKMMSPQWSTVMVGAHGTFSNPYQLAVTSYDQWCQMWPHIAGPYYTRGMEVPQFIDWNTEQIIFLSVGNMGSQGYGMFVEEVRRTSNFQFDVRFAVTRPDVQASFGYQQSSYNNQSLYFGTGQTPFVALRVPRSYGIPNFHWRYYSPPSYVIRNGCGCGHCGGHSNRVWMMGAGGVLIPYTPPGQQQGKGGN